MARKKRVLYICSLPKKQPMLRFIHEISLIQDFLLEGTDKKYIFSPKIGVRPSRLDKVILGREADIPPYVLHFSMHASRTEGLIMANENMERETVPFPIVEHYIKQLKYELAEELNTTVKCVFFNCCHSLDLAKAISAEVEYVIGTIGAVPDDACVEFSRAFYSCLFDAATIKNAYKRAKYAVKGWKIKENIEDEEGEELYENRFVLFYKNELVNVSLA